MSKIIDTKIKQKVLVKKPDISGFTNDSDLNKKIETLAKKANWKAEQDKKVKLKIYNLSYFLGKHSFGDDGS